MGPSFLGGGGTVTTTVETVLRENGTDAGGRDGFLDTVRAIAIVRVIVWHAFGFAAISYFVAAVPAMFFVSGSLIAGSLDRRAVRAVFSDRLRRLLVPFWVFGAVAFVVMVSAYATRPGSNTVLHWWQPIFWIAPIVYPTGSHWQGGWLSASLWYVSILLWLIFLGPMLLRAVRRRPRLCFAVSVGWVFVLGVPARGETTHAQMGLGALANLGLFVTMFMLGFLHHDGFFARFGRRTRIGACAGFALGAAAWCITQPVPFHVVNYSAVAQLLVGLTWLSFALACEPTLARVPAMPRIGPCVTWLTQRSMTIYLWHTTAIILAYQLLWKLDWSLPWGGFVVLLLAFTAVFVACLTVLFGWAEDLGARRAPRLWPSTRRTVPVPVSVPVPVPRTSRQWRPAIAFLAAFNVLVIAGSLVVSDTKPGAHHDQTLSPEMPESSEAREGPASRSHEGATKTEVIPARSASRR